MSLLTVVMLDDHQLFARACADMLSVSGRYMVLGTFDNAEECYAFVLKTHPRIVLVDINMSPVNGFEATREICRLSSITKVIGLSVAVQPAYAKKLVQCGAKGYLTKNCDKEELMEAMEEVHKGRRFLGKDIRDILADNALSGNCPMLSSKEIDVIIALKQGLSSQEIAERLKLSRKTIEVHRHHILRKLNLHNTASLINYVNMKGI